MLNFFQENDWERGKGKSEYTRTDNWENCVSRKPDLASDNKQKQFHLLTIIKNILAINKYFLLFSIFCRFIHQPHPQTS
jgi:hypothetical protein